MTVSPACSPDNTTWKPVPIPPGHDIPPDSPAGCIGIHIFVPLLILQYTFIGGPPAHRGGGETDRLAPGGGALPPRGIHLVLVQHGPRDPPHHVPAPGRGSRGVLQGG